MRAALVKTRFVGGVVPPTIPVKVTFPPVPAFTVRTVAPLTVLLKLMFAPAAVPPALVVSRVGEPDSTTGPAIVMTPPAVVSFPPTLICVAPVYVKTPVVFTVLLCVIVAAVTARLASGVVPPTAPVKVVVPEPPAIVKA